MTLGQPKAAVAPSDRINWLDGWRAIAVSIVIQWHLAAFYHLRIAVDGRFGVYIFFAISGYIVCRLLLLEKAKSGSIDISAFFIRRAARILPPLLIYVLLCVAMFWQGQILISAIKALSFTCNIALVGFGCTIPLQHTWSLAFEEQFYLMAPFLIARKGRRSLAITVPIALLAFAFPIFVGRSGYIQIYGLLAAGGMLAAFEDRITPILARVPLWVSCTAGILGTSWLYLPDGLARTILGPAVSLLIALAVFGLPIRSPGVRRVLASKPLRTIGLYSYSLYLWQELAIVNVPWNRGLMPFVLIAGALALSAISYGTVEAYCRSWARSVQRKRLGHDSESSVNAAGGLVAARSD
jgi:peptidoglycan/LPS O-acetylase OafA/YrhL